MTISTRPACNVGRCYGNVKYHGHMVDISIFLQGMNEQLLKV